MANASKYIIECDKRDSGGEITVVRTYRTLSEAWKAWNEFIEPEDWRLQYWLVAVFVKKDGNEQHNVMEFKGRS